VPEPGDPQSLNRYSYVKNSPLHYTDPTGHVQACTEGDYGGRCGVDTFDSAAVWASARKLYPNWAEYYAGLATYRAALVAGASDVVLESLQGQLAISYLRSNQSVAQADFDPGMAIDPGSAFKVAEGLAPGAIKAVARFIDKISANGAMTTIRSPRAPNPNGMNGNPDHQAVVQGLIQMAQTEFDGRSVNIEQNKSIKDALSIDRRPDVSVRDRQTAELLKVYEAARVDPNGNFIPREQQKMFEYWEAGISYYFGAVR